MEINCPSCNEAVLIADEDKATTIECPFCQQRFALEQPEPPPVLEPPPIKEPESSTNERVFLEIDGATITDKRVMVGGRTYACKQITSVGVTRDSLGAKIPALLWGKPTWVIVLLSSVLFFVFSGITLIFAFIVFKTAQSSGGLIIVTAILTFIFGVIAFITLITWMIQSGRRHPRYWVEIATASGREQAMLCLNQESAQEVCNAINQAIIDN